MPKPPIIAVDGYDPQRKQTSSWLVSSRPRCRLHSSIVKTGDVCLAQALLVTGEELSCCFQKQQMVVQLTTDVRLISFRSRQSTQQAALISGCKGHDQMERMYSPDKQVGSEVSYKCERGNDGLQHLQHQCRVSHCSLWLHGLQLSYRRSYKAASAMLILTPSSDCGGASNWLALTHRKTTASWH